MKKKSILSIVLVGALTLGLTGCGSKGGSDEKTIKIGVTPVPHAEIIEVVKPILEKEGYKVEVTEFNDYVTPNTALAEGSLDANFFQHIAYLNETNENKGLDLTYTAEVHLEPLGLYSNKVKSLDKIADGSKIAVPNDPTNGARALRLLERHGLIKLKDGELITAKDITENKKKLEIVEIAAEQLPRTLDDVTAAVINGNYAINAGLSVKDALVIEDKDAENIKPYINILAVKKGNEGIDKIKALSDALNSEEVKKFIEDKYDGSVIPAF